jgi:UDP-2-acetamido-2-deoxy-ribo-hexuluronate aminotransferase
VKVPFVDLKHAAALVQNEARARWASIVEQTEFLGGATVQALEQALGATLGARHVVACSSGTHALVMALQALGIGPGKKVALPNLTFWATYEAVAQLGASPVLIDVDPEDLQLSLPELGVAFEQLRFEAAILVHLMGWASPRLAELRRFCAERGIALLEDGAQSFGVEVDGSSVYAGARLSALSFYPAKVLGGCMDGGAMVTDDAALAEHCRKLANHGRSSHFSYSHLGWSSRMGGLQAAWLLEMLKHASAIVARRRALLDRYQAELASCLAATQGYKLVLPPAGVRGNGYLCVGTLDRSSHEAVAASLAVAGISVGRVYPSTLADQEPARDALRVSDLGHSRAFCRKVLNLPLYYGMSDDELGYVTRELARVLRS